MPSALAGDAVDAAQQIVRDAILGTVTLELLGHGGVVPQRLAQHGVEAHTHAGAVAMLDHDRLAGRKGLLAHDRGPHRPAGAMERLPGRIGAGRNEQSVVDKALLSLPFEFGNAVLLRSDRKDRQSGVLDRRRNVLLAEKGSLIDREGDRFAVDLGLERDEVDRVVGRNRVIVGIRKIDVGQRKRDRHVRPASGSD